MAKTERESDNRRREEMADLLVLPRPAKSVQNGAGFSGMKRKEWPQYHRESTWQVCWSRPCQKEKGKKPSVESARS